MLQEEVLQELIPLIFLNALIEELESTAAREATNLFSAPGATCTLHTISGTTTWFPM